MHVAYDSTPPYFVVYVVEVDANCGERARGPPIRTASAPSSLW
jgi:hypothetical protein